MTRIKNKTEQLAAKLSGMILSGKYRPGSRLPSERQLENEYWVSRITARRAVLELASQGIVERKPGRGGTVITENAVEIIREMKTAESLPAIGIVLHPAWVRDAIMERYFRNLIGAMRHEVSFRIYFHKYLKPDKYRSDNLKLLIIDHGFSNAEVNECENEFDVISFIRCRGKNYILPDYELGGKLALRYLAEKGHERIVCFRGGSQENSQSYEGIFKEADRLGGKLISIDLRSVREVAVGMEKLMTDHGPFNFTAIIAPTARDAVLIHGILENAGLEVPGDISIISCDDLFFAENFVIPITAVQQSYEAINMLLVKTIRKYIKTDKIQLRETVPPIIIERQSVQEIIS
jgi:GntR family transcriptional regulator of arabinose operon